MMIVGQGRRATCHGWLRVVQRLWLDCSGWLLLCCHPKQLLRCLPPRAAPSLPPAPSSSFVASRPEQLLRCLPPRAAPSLPPAPSSSFVASHLMASGSQPSYHTTSKLFHSCFSTKFFQNFNCTLFVLLPRDLRLGR